MIILIIPIILSFFIVFFILPEWIKKARRIGLSWEDLNKYRKTKVAGSGGLIVILGFILGVLSYIFLKTFYFETQSNIIEIFALTTSVLILAGVGLTDDLLGWWSGGLSKKFRLIMCVFASIPLVVINVGYPEISLPLIGKISLGIFYALVLIPIGVSGAATTFNFLAGFNGLEAGEGILLVGALSLVAYLTGSSWLSLIGLCMVSALFAFLVYNKFPAKVFPGDVLTYPIGGLIAIMAILGNFEKIAILFFLPCIIETFLKIRGRLKKQSFGKPNRDGSLEPAYKKIYSLNHIAIFFLKKIKGKAYEKDVVLLIWLFQLLVIFFGFLIFTIFKV